MSEPIRQDDRTILRDLAKRYLEICNAERNVAAIELWRDFNSLRGTRPPVLCSYDYTAMAPEIREAVGERRCESFRDVEFALRRWIWGADIADDHVYQPWVTVRAPMRPPGCGSWGIEIDRIRDEHSRGWRNMPVVRGMADLNAMEATPHECLDAHPPEAKQLEEILGDILPVHVRRSTVYPKWGGTDLSEAAGALLGLEELMYALYEKPDLVHRMMAFMRDAVVANLTQSEAAGDVSTAESDNYGSPAYSHELPDPAANSHGARLKDLCFFTHAQEFEAVGPAQHEEFLLNYQMPIMELFGQVNYGCCETLDNKIEMLRKVPNLRKILAGPTADFRKCVERIGSDYLISWRPNPAAMVSSGFDAASVRKQVREALAVADGCHLEIMLKELMTLEGDVTRLGRWTEIAMDEAQRAG